MRQEAALHFPATVARLAECAAVQRAPGPARPQQSHATCDLRVRPRRAQIAACVHAIPRVAAVLPRAVRACDQVHPALTPMPHSQAEKVALELSDKRAERAVLRLLARAHREVRMGMRLPAAVMPLGSERGAGTLLTQALTRMGPRACTLLSGLRWEDCQHGTLVPQCPHPLPERLICLCRKRHRRPCTAMRHTPFCLN